MDYEEFIFFYKVNVVDFIGVGDLFVGVFVYYYMNGEDILIILRYVNVYVVVIVMMFGS